MGGSGTFWDPRLNDASRFPIAAKAGFGNRRPERDLITPKLAALHAYQLVIPPPRQEQNPFDGRARHGRDLFAGKARCATCHVPPLYTEPGWNMHTPEEIGIDSFQANRSPDGRYRTTPLGGMIAKQKGGFYHDGRFASLIDVINHYDRHFSLRLTEDEKRDLAAFVGAL
jgi:cytochrome c peroxidase